MSCEQCEIFKQEIKSMKHREKRKGSKHHSARMALKMARKVMLKYFEDPEVGACLLEIETFMGNLSEHYRRVKKRSAAANRNE